MAGEPLDGKDREWQANTKLDDEHKKLGVKLLKVASAMQFTLPGFPCIYYGDEAGIEGYRDPFNRCCYPWGKENKELIEWHKKLADVRKSCSALDPNWSGIVYPGGHVEAGESIAASVIREIREETGLTIENPTLCGVKQFWLDNGVRYIVFLFRADKFTGELHGSEEGDAFWLPRE